jgi:hypothetical protein
MAAATEGTLPFRGHRTWYQVVGEIPASRARSSPCSSFTADQGCLTITSRT